MDGSQKHQMVFVGKHQTGHEEWFCPICGRRLLMHAPPNYSKKVLTPGDEMVTHSASKYGFQLDMTASSAVSGEQNANDHAVIEEKLDNLRNMLKAAALDHLL
ncbi:hypothetical protein [Candidatus Chlorohelix sp.]|uniref:hypothetical protein n=1 Tax=Candidatus Chlorohelix sp. TaxID=3139201 RepID=UPI00305287BA